MKESVNLQDSSYKHVFISRVKNSLDLDQLVFQKQGLYNELSIMI